jgi:hypothetical protein
VLAAEVDRPLAAALQRPVDIVAELVEGFGVGLRHNSNGGASGGRKAHSDAEALTWRRPDRYERAAARRDARATREQDTSKLTELGHHGPQCPTSGASTVSGRLAGRRSRGSAGSDTEPPDVDG